MSKKITYEDEPFGKVTLGKRVKLAKLPSPAALAEANKTAKVTLALSTQSLRFFKEQAAKHHMPYQTMIRSLLDAYAAEVRQ